MLPWKLRIGATRRALRYSRFGEAEELHAFGQELDIVLGSLNLGKRALILSDENLCGRMPGREGHEGYGAAPALMARIAQVITARYGPQVDLQFLLTTREAEPWLQSSWVHNLRASRLTQDFADYARTHAGTARLGQTVAAIRQAVAPHPVHDARLEELSGTPAGPATAILDLLELPDHLRQRLAPDVHHNRSADQAIALEMLALNRSALDDATLRRKKAALLRKPIETDGPSP